MSEVELCPREYDRNPVKIGNFRLRNALNAECFLMLNAERRMLNAKCSGGVGGNKLVAGNLRGEVGWGCERRVLGGWEGLGRNKGIGGDWEEGIWWPEGRAVGRH